MSTIKTNQLAHTANGAATYTLPQTDGSAGQVLQTNGSGVLSWVTLPTGGLSMHESWHVSSALDPAGGSNDITGTWARSNSTHGYIGSAMTESSGVFTFPSTGIYYVQITGGFFRTSSDSHGYTGFNILTATDGSSFSNKQGNYSAIPGLSGTTYSIATASYTFDVTSTSTHKVKFQTVVEGSGTSVLESNNRKLNVEFTKLGET